MDIKYKIISIDENESSFTVRYFTDFLSEDQLASYYDIDNEIVRDTNGSPVRCRTDYNISIDISHENNFSKSNIESLIINSAPVKWFENKQKIIQNPSLSSSLMSNVSILLNSINNFDTNNIVKMEQNKIIELDNDLIVKGNISISKNLSVLGTIISNN